MQICIGDSPYAVGRGFEFSDVESCSLSNGPAPSTLRLTSEGHDLGSVATEVSYGDPPDPDVSCDSGASQCFANLGVNSGARLYFERDDGTLNFVDCPGGPCDAVPMGQFQSGETLLVAEAYPIYDDGRWLQAVSYTHLRAHETVLDLVCRLLLEKKKQHLQSADLHYKNRLITHH